MPLEFPQFLQRHGFDVAVVKGYIDGATVAIGAEAAHAGVVTAVVGSGGGVIFHRPSIYPDAVSKHRRFGRITFLRGDIKHIPVPVIGAVHVWMIPAVEPIAARHAPATVNLRIVVPSAPTAFVIPPPAAKIRACAGAEDDLVGILNVIKNLVVPKVIVPVSPRFMARIIASIAIAGVTAFVIIRPHFDTLLDTFQIVTAFGGIGLTLGAGQSGEQKAGEDANNGDHHQKFDESESAGVTLM